MNNGKEISDQIGVNNELYTFYQKLYRDKLSVTKENAKIFLNSLNVPTMNENHFLECERSLNESDILAALKSMKNEKSPGNDGISKEFYEVFWEHIRIPLMQSINNSFYINELSNSQKQAVIKLIEKKDKDKRLIKNWRPISLLNVDAKLISKALANKLKNVIPSLVSANQTAFVKDRYISEGGRLISDILEISSKLGLKGYLMTVDIEKAFDSVNHIFLICVLERFGFGVNFLKWIKILLKNQESCVINGVKTTKYFQLHRGTRQGDPISPYLFILVLEMVFHLIKTNTNIEGLNIFDNNFLYTAYADDTTFFTKDEKFVMEIINVFDKFSFFSGLKLNKEKCEIAGIGVKKGVNLALCGIQCVNLEEDCIKILGVYYSYSKVRENEMNFVTHVKKYKMF